MSPAIAKTLTTFDCGYVGMTRVPSTALSRYFAEVDAALAADGPDIHVERILARLATSATPPALSRHQRPRLARSGYAPRARPRRSSLRNGGWA
jgi:hypothetical protein